LIIVVIFFYVAKKGELVGMIVLPLFCYAVLVAKPGFTYNIYLVIVALYIVTIGITNTVRFKLIQIHDETFRSHWWRIILRPCATIFIVLYLFWPQRQVLIFVGSVALVFILLDVLRFVVRAANELFTVRIKSFFKKSESRRFSSMTMFLFASFIIVLLFQKDIAIAALAYLIFGDIFSKIYGLAFGRRKLFDKTVEGSLAYLGGALICAYVLHTALHIPMLILGIGAVAATIAEFMPVGIDDNFTVGIFSGAVMTVVRTFW
jgi:glycerol-3-phosphate acyltransferase PlsY